MASTALTMVVIGACATCLRHIRCPISMIAPTLGIRTASERQEALQTLLSFICRDTACLLPCWHNVRRPSRTLFKKRQRHNTQHMVIWSFCRFLCLVIGFAAYLLKIGRNESRRRTISFSSYSIGIFPFILLVLSFPVYFPVFFFFLPFFHFSFIFPSFLLSIFIPPTNLQPSCGRG